MRRPAAELRERVGEGTWLRLGASMSACLAPLARILAEEGVREPDFTANRIYTQVLGTMHRAHRPRGQRGGRRARRVPLDAERVRLACVSDAIALARAAR